MIYTINGSAQSTAFDVNGGVLSQCYDMQLNPLLGPHKPIKSYDYASDSDPDKAIVWNYDLNALRNDQGNSFTLGIQTDTHFVMDDAPASYAQYNPPQTPHGTAYATPLKNLTKRLYFDAIVNMGDIPHGWGTDYETPAVTKRALQEMMRRYTSHVECSVLIARGNHDPGMYQHGAGHPQTMDSVVSKTDLYDIEIGGVKATTGIVEPEGTNFYYYKDYDECRVIVLDTNDYPYQEISEYDVHGNHHTISEAQLTWFENVALDTDKPVLIISHNTLLIGVLPTANPYYASVEDKAYDRSAPYRCDQVMAALKAWRDDGGTVIACLCGHVHQQDSAKVDGINHIVFCDGGKFAEIVFVDFDARTITTRIVGIAENSDHLSRNLENRTFTF